MTHESETVIIHRLSAPVTFSEDETPKRLKVWHLFAACAVIGFIVGLAF
jgi:hypothetical protein